MTVATSNSKSGPYAGAGTTGPFTVDFRFLENSHLQVVKTSAAGVESTLALGSGYTVAGAGAESGTVTLVVALAVGERLTITRNVPSTQEADYVQNDAFPAASHELALDKLTMLDQQNREQLQRAMKLPVSLEGVSTAMPLPVAGRGLKWNAGGTALVNSDQDLDAIAAAANGSAAASAASAASAAASYDALDDRFLGVKPSDPALDNDGAALAEGTLYWNSAAKEFRVFNGASWQVVVPSGNLQKMTYVAGVDYTAGVTTTLTLPVDPLVKANLDIVFDAAFQQMTEFSLSGTTLTFNAPIPVGVAQVEISYTTPLQIGTVSDGTVTNAQVATGAAIDSSKLAFLQAGTGAFTRTAQDKLRDSVSLKDFGAVGNGVADDTAALQAAINYAAASQKPLESDGATYMVSGLTIPSSLTWRGSTTVIKLISNSNKPVLANSVTSFLPENISNANIDIRGLIIDGNGLNQANNTAELSLVVGVRFHGVNNLHLDITVRNSRRYAYWLLNCNHVRGNAVAEWTPDYIAGGASPNRDSMHINGNSFDIHFDTITVYRGGDDAFALNADDVAHGGIWTQAAVSGPIIGASVDQINIVDSHNGVRLLSANYEVSEVNIGQVIGDVNYYALVVEAYGLGTASLYRNIHIETLSLTYKDSADAGRSQTALVKIDTAKSNPTYVSNFSFGTIERASQGVDATSRNRDTLYMSLRRCNVKVDKIVERDCSNEVTCRLLGDPLNLGASGPFVEFDLRHHQRNNSSVAANGKYGITLYVVQAKNVDRVKVDYINADARRYGVFIDGSTITNLDLWRIDNAVEDAISISSGSTIQNLMVGGVPSTMFFNAPYQVDGTSSVLGIGVSGDTGPFAVVSAFANSWTSLGAPYASVGYRKSAAGMVELRGILNGGTVNQPAFTLPAGFRPANQKIFACLTSTANAATLKIAAAGTVTPADNTSGYIGLDGITFRAEQ